MLIIKLEINLSFHQLLNLTSFSSRHVYTLLALLIVLCLFIIPLSRNLKLHSVTELLTCMSVDPLQRFSVLIEQHRFSSYSAEAIMTLNDFNGQIKVITKSPISDVFCHLLCSLTENVLSKCTNVLILGSDFI